MPEVTEFELDGACFSTLEEFAAHFSERVLPRHRWNGHVDAFNDILRGGFGTPEDGFRLVWHNSQLSKLRLGCVETVRQLEARLATCHAANRQRVSAELERARLGLGPTVFDWLVEIIADHGPGGSQAEDGIVLELR